MLPPFWDYRREYDELRDEILAAVDRVFKSGQLILGPEGIAFERDMAGYVGVGGRLYLTRRFFMRGEYRQYVVFTKTNANEVNGEWRLGFAFFY